MQHRSKEKKVLTINDRDFEARIGAFLEFQRGIKSAETTTENKHACLVTHNLGQTVPANTITKIPFAAIYPCKQAEPASANGSLFPAACWKTRRLARLELRRARVQP